MTGHVETARLIHIFFISHSRRSLLCVNMQGVLSRVFLAYVCDFQRAYPRACSRRGALINLSCRGERKKERERKRRTGTDVSPGRRTWRKKQAWRAASRAADIRHRTRRGATRRRHRLRSFDRFINVHRGSAAHRTFRGVPRDPHDPQRRKSPRFQDVKRHA